MKYLRLLPVIFCVLLMSFPAPTHARPDLARKLGMDPVDVRRKNLLSDHQPKFATGQNIKSAWLGRKTLEAAVEKGQDAAKEALLFHCPQRFSGEELARDLAVFWFEVARQRKDVVEPDGIRRHSQRLA